MGDEKDFKVNDKRASSGYVDSTPKKPAPEEAKGEGFTMKKGEESASEPTAIDFSTFVFSLATGALINMGLAPDPVTNKVTKNLELARQNIELIAMLKDKTRGNLSEDESKLLESLLSEIRLRFVSASAH